MDFQPRLVVDKDALYVAHDDGFVRKWDQVGEMSLDFDPIPIGGVDDEGRRRASSTRVGAVTAAYGRLTWCPEPHKAGAARVCSYCGHCQPHHIAENCGGDVAAGEDWVTEPGSQTNE